MPHGYECDRCETFVEQPGEFSQDFHAGLQGNPTELVRIFNPSLQSDEGQGVEEYTLCDTCRDTIIAIVESGQGVGL